MINQTEKLGTALNDGIATPVQNIAANLTESESAAWND